MRAYGTIMLLFVKIYEAYSMSLQFLFNVWLKEEAICFIKLLVGASMELHGPRRYVKRKHNYPDFNQRDHSRYNFWIFVKRHVVFTLHQHGTERR